MNGDCIIDVDCSGECGGSAAVDECGVCNGDGIADGACDCDGNVDDCAGVCGGDAVVGGCDQTCGSKHKHVGQKVTKHVIRYRA